MYKYKDIKKVHLEITQRCQAACPMCDRNENGGVENKHIKDAELSIDDCKSIFKPKFIQQLDLMYMCGNLGDPIIAKDTLAVFKYFREQNPNIWLSMHTNGGAKDSEWWEELAQILGDRGTVIFSVDGLRDTNHLYRQNVNWDKVENSMKSFINAGGRARWDFIIFEHNQHQTEEAEALSKLWGFEKFVTKKTARFFSSAKNTETSKHQVQNKQGQKTIVINKPKPEFQNKALMNTPKLINEYGSMLSYYDQIKIECKVAKESSIFISAEGLLLPCCWTAGRMYKWWHADYKKEQIWEFIDKHGGVQGINVITNDLAEVIDHNGILENIANSWDITSVAAGKLQVCSMKCGTEFDAFKAQWDN